jgi:nucleotide-binding universal stress UspA family protein
MPKPIVVGVDGSTLAHEAVRWAAREAVLRKAPLRIVHACMPESEPARPELAPSMVDTLVAAGRQWLSEAAQVATDTAPEVELTTELVREYDEPALIDETRTAQLVVLGARGQGGFSELLVGSMAAAAAAQGRCPVVVIRGTDQDLHGRPILVGVDGSPASEAAIAFAYDEASRLGVPVIALHTWTDTITAVAFAMAPYAVDWFEVQNMELRLLAERLAGWQEKYPDVEVQRVVTRDHPAHSLVEQARQAQLVVVGSRGRGQVAGLLLGSTSQALLHHAPCPLVIVRPDI